MSLLSPIKTTAVALALALPLVFAPGAAQAQSLRHIDELAYTMLQAAERLHDEFHAHLDGYRLSAHMDADITEIERKARHIHDIAHEEDPHDLDHIRVDVDALDRLVHHVDDLVDEMAREGVFARDWAGIDHTRREIRILLDTLHHMQADLRALTQPRPHYHGHSSYDRYHGYGDPQYTPYQPQYTPQYTPYQPQYQPQYAPQYTPQYDVHGHGHDHP